MKKATKLTEIVSTLWEASELLAKLPLTSFARFTILISILLVKRFIDVSSDKATQSDRGWTSQETHLLHVVDSYLHLISQKKNLKNLAQILKLTRYSTAIGTKDHARLSEIFAALDTASLSNDEIVSIIDPLIEALYSSTQPIAEHLTPTLLNNLVVRLLNPRDHEYFYVPSFGLGRIFLTVLQRTADKSHQKTIFDSPSIQFGGCEGNQEVWAIAVVIALLANINVDRLRNEDYFSSETYTILSSEHEHVRKRFLEVMREREVALRSVGKPAAPKKEIKKFISGLDNDARKVFWNALKALEMEADVLFLKPRFSLRLPAAISSQVTFEGQVFQVPQSNAELLYTMLGLKQLKRDGRMAVILPLSSLTREGSVRDIWQFLCHNDYLEAIVQLPEKVSSHSIPTVLVLFNKKKSPLKQHKYAFIKFQEASEGSDVSDAEIERIHSVFDDFKPRSSSDFVASLEDIQQNEYKLSPVYYLGGMSAEIKKLLDTKLGRRLEEVCKVVRGKTPKPTHKLDTTGIPFITTKNLTKDVTEPRLKLNDVIFSSPNLFDEPLSRRCILVSLVGRDPKPTIYEPRGDDIGILAGHNIAILLPNETVIDFEYLYYQFYTPFFRRQLEALAGGTGIPSLSLQSLKSVIISTPPLDVQRSLVSQQKDLLFQAENRRHQAALERLKGVGKKQEAEFSIVRHLTHSIRPKLHIIRSPILSLIDFLSQHHLLEETLSVKLDGSQESVRGALEQAIKSIDQISDVLASTRKLVTCEISRNDFNDIDICSAFQNDIKPLYSSKAFKTIVHCRGDCVISVHKESFVEAIHNLILNAEVHAFNATIKNPEVRFDIRGNEDEVIIDYTNTGVRFPEDMTVEQFLAYGEKSGASPGEGLGGAWISRFLDAHMASLVIIRDKHPLHFKITLPRRYE